jgi:hypothetical protein
MQEKNLTRKGEERKETAKDERQRFSFWLCSIDLHNGSTASGAEEHAKALVRPYHTSIPLSQEREREIAQTREREGERGREREREGENVADPNSFIGGRLFSLLSSRSVRLCIERKRYA